jgi:hypothetical protein
MDCDVVQGENLTRIFAHSKFADGNNGKSKYSQGPRMNHVQILRGWPGIAMYNESRGTDFARRKVDNPPTSGSSEVTESCDSSESEYDFFISLLPKGSVSNFFQMRCTPSLAVISLAA